ncbi:VIT1/CCC1 transporter family protein [Candidatus Giovannonibacteria bacterium]|nr:VIT1/CCC1 transporter family protein [Candidatus Giovannonibacteria bacterium]
MNRSKILSASYLRNFVFGVEDSLASTVGLLSGIAYIGATSSAIFTTGIILIFVEAFSMAIGSFLSESSAENYIHHDEEPLGKPLKDGAIMFLSYFISGFIPLFPYIIMEVENAFIWSVILSLLALFLLGAVGAKISKIHVVRNGFKTFIIGGIAIVVGVTVGTIFS